MEHNILFTDLCTRLPYKPMVCVHNVHGEHDEELSLNHLELLSIGNGVIVKPYLRSLSKMTKEEKEELRKLHFSIRYEDWLNRYAKLVNYTYEDLIIRGYPNEKYYKAHDVNETTCINLIDWLNAHHFDYRGFIGKRLALEAPEGMYNI